jgi:hypothetical protein
MLDAQAIRLMHLHDDQLVPMTEVVDNPARHDEEREWVRGRRIFQCSVCDEQVVVQGQAGEGQGLAPEG